MTELSQPAELTGVAKDLGVTRTSWGKGSSSYSLTITESHCNKGGVAFGGLHTVLLDMALGGGLVSLLPVEEWCATTALTTSFITPAHVGETITATGRVVKRGRNVAHLAGEVASESGRIVATATGTWAIWQSKPASMG